MPASDVVVAQSRNDLLVWYNIDSPERVTVCPIKVSDSVFSLWLHEDILIIDKSNFYYYSRLRWLYRWKKGPEISASMLFQCLNFQIFPQLLINVTFEETRKLDQTTAGIRVINVTYITVSQIFIQIFIILGRYYRSGERRW